jgi:hypothetical protein
MNFLSSINDVAPQVKATDLSQPNSAVCQTLNNYAFIAETIETAIAHLAGYAVGFGVDNLIRTGGWAPGDKMANVSICKTNAGEEMYFNSAKRNDNSACGVGSSMLGYLAGRATQYVVRGLCKVGLRHLEGLVLKLCGYTDGKVPRMKTTGYEVWNDLLKLVLIGGVCDLLSPVTKKGGLKVDPDVNNAYLSCAVSTMWDVVNGIGNYSFGRVQVLNRGKLSDPPGCDFAKDQLLTTLFASSTQALLCGPLRTELGVKWGAFAIQPSVLVGNKYARNLMLGKLEYFTGPCLLQDARNLGTPPDNSAFHAVLGVEDCRQWKCEGGRITTLRRLMAEQIPKSDTNFNGLDPYVKAAYVQFVAMLFAASHDVRDFELDGASDLKVRALRLHIGDINGPQLGGQRGMWISTTDIQHADCEKLLQLLETAEELKFRKEFELFLCESTSELPPNCLPQLAKVAGQPVSITFDNGTNWVHLDANGTVVNNRARNAVAVQFADGHYRRVQEPPLGGFLALGEEPIVANFQENQRRTENSVRSNGQGQVSGDVALGSNVEMQSQQIPDTVSPLDERSLNNSRVGGIRDEIGDLQPNAQKEEQGEQRGSAKSISVVPPLVVKMSETGNVQVESSKLNFQESQTASNAVLNVEQGGSIPPTNSSSGGLGSHISSFFGSLANKLLQFVRGGD